MASGFENQGILQAQKRDHQYCQPEKKIRDLVTMKNWTFTASLCLKITEKVSFNTASEASLHFEWTKVNKNAKNGPFWRVFEYHKLAVKQCYQTGQF